MQFNEMISTFVSSNDQLADLLVKLLRMPRVEYICNKLAFIIYLKGEML